MVSNCELTSGNLTFFTSDKGGGKCVCLSVCLLARLLENMCMHLDEMLRVDRCRNMDELINFFSLIWIIIWMPEPDCFLRHRMRCNAEFYYVGKISRIGILLGTRHCSEA